MITQGSLTVATGTEVFDLLYPGLRRGLKESFASKSSHDYEVVSPLLGVRVKNTGRRWTEIVKWYAQRDFVRYAGAQPTDWRAVRVSGVPVAGYVYNHVVAWALEDLDRERLLSTDAELSTPGLPTVERLRVDRAPVSLRLDEALRAADNGYAVMPLCRPTKAGCMDHGRGCYDEVKKASFGGKKPLPGFSVDQATSSHEQIKAWWREGDYNPGVKTGPSGLLVVDYDIDPRKPRGRQWLEKHYRAGRRLQTRAHRTGGGGRHWIYRRPEALNHGNRIVKGLDLRGALNQHYVAWVGSRHASGRLYEVAKDLPVADLPDWIVEEIARAARVERPDVATPFGETILEKLWALAGLPVLATQNRAGVLKSWVPCPLEHEHTTSRKRFDSVMISGDGVPLYGRFKCAHGSHDLTTYQVVQMLRRLVGEEPFEEVTREYRARARVEHAHLANLDECGAQIEELFRTIDDTRGKIVVVQLTTGLGKTTGARRYLANHGDRPTSVFFPNHALAGENAEKLEKEHLVVAAHPMGVGSFKDMPCVFPDMATAAAELKVPIRQDVCRSCPHRKNYLGSGMPCVAGGSSTALEGRHRLLQHATLDAVLRDRADGEERDLVIVDEQPPLVDAVTIDLALLSNPKTFDLYGLDDQAKKSYARLAGYLVQAQRFYSSPERATYATAHDVVSVGTSEKGQRKFTFADQTAALVREIADRDLPSPVEAGARLAQKVTAGAYPDAEGMLKQLARTYSLLYALKRACLYPDRECFEFKMLEGGAATVTVRAPAAWVVEAARYARKGGTVLVMSASAHAGALREAAPDVVEVRHVHAEDAPGVERRFIFDRNVSRKQFTGRDGKVREGVLRDAMERVLDEVRGLTSVLVVTHKPVADALRQRRADFLPDGWEAAIAAGARLHVAHYGAVVGLDQWRDVDAVVTVGDPIPNLDDAKACARAMGVPEGEYLNALVQGEMLQAHGRGRACRREGPLLIAHFGIYTPDVSISPQWRRYVLPKLHTC